MKHRPLTADEQAMLDRAAAELVTPDLAAMKRALIGMNNAFAQSDSDRRARQARTNGRAA